ncbi:hypothetical protein [Spirosoma pollinicola]|uniref:DUF4352 domain-containing protein n=1 Tax=Spirosoma pollinicola TaxID=2057025 RepID=A0A2K8Z8N4_9BACT|nr:hypothetical protein [Spirosoma pollinicola]AUD06189.1 hypothetical protein CWM47_32705 [Spirosoma pollinicola]
MKPLSVLIHTLAIGFAATVLSSCAPTLTTAYQLEPVSGDLATIDGRAVTKAEQNGVGVVASFEREDMEFITLDIEVKNRTDHSIDVNPADFHFTALDGAHNTLTDPNNPSLELTRPAADPTYEAGRMNMKRKQEEKRLKTAKVLNTVLMVALVASDISSSSNSHSYREYTTNRVTHGLGYQGLAVKRAIDYSNFANRMQRYDYEEYRWRELALKANTLAPGESVRGFVYFPKASAARYLAINYTVPELATVPLLFKQDLVQEKKNRRRR